MSLAITHFAVGAACTAVVLMLVPRVPFQRTLVVCGGIWAMLPDAWRFLPTSGARYAHEFHATPLANVFWFHNALDRADVGDSQATGVALLAVFLLVTATVEYRDYRTPEPVREALPDAVFEDD
ncbi:hypothetical protein [Halosimplex carlsbadense]|nr:hypothetical protein [Halosimplex carlsbadense]